MAMVLFEDSYIIAVSKPNNMLVHHSPMARNQIEEQSLVQHLFTTFKRQFYPIHRLDRKTSGVILLAKEKKHVTSFQNLIESNALNKTYYGLVRGHIKKFGVIDSPVKGRDANIYKTALTYFECLQHIELPIPVGPYRTSRYSLVKLSPKTGRLHQLRIHMNKISHPLIGDPKYGDRFHNRMFEKEFDSDKLFLHAYSVAFKHPYTLENIIIESDLPSQWSISNLNLIF